VEVAATEGRLRREEVREAYQRVDYVLVPATVEGGPMSLLEGLSLGKPVIAPEGIGLVPELPPSSHVRLYRAGDADDLVRVVTACYEEKCSPGRLVEGRTFDRWAESHHRLFARALAARGCGLPEAAPGFRFGLTGELEVPPGADARSLEEAVDRASRHLFYGRYGETRRALEAAAQAWPCVLPLLEKVPTG
jgi:hypothetical protein